MSTISLVQPDEPLRIQKILIFPYPDLKRLWFRMQLQAQPNQQPNIDIDVAAVDGPAGNSLAFVAYDDTYLDATIHLKEPHPGSLYQCVVDLSLGLPPDMEHVEQVKFEFPLEFRDAEKGADGFGYDCPDPVSA